MNIRPEDILDDPLTSHARGTLRNSQRWFPAPDDVSDRWRIEHRKLVRLYPINARPGGWAIRLDDVEAL